MNLNSKKASVIILAITSLIISRATFFFINDPEGPNLLIVTVLAAVIFAGAAVTFLKFKKYALAVAVQIVLAAGFLALASYFPSGTGNMQGDYKNISYRIDGRDIQLKDGIRYFGNDLVTDLDGDGQDDIVFLITQQAGGSGTFYYAVAALGTDKGYKGSDGYFLGDRIAPQTIDNSQNPRHKNVVVVNYADRAPSEPMISQPSIGKSVYLKLDPATMQWGIVAPDFEGESR